MQTNIKNLPANNSFSHLFFFLLFKIRFPLWVFLFLASEWWIKLSLVIYCHRFFCRRRCRLRHFVQPCQPHQHQLLLPHHSGSLLSSWTPPSHFMFNFVSSSVVVAFSVANFATIFLFTRHPPIITTYIRTVTAHTKEDILCCAAMTQTPKTKSLPLTAIHSSIPFSSSQWKLWLGGGGGGGCGENDPINTKALSLFCRWVVNCTVQSIATHTRNNNNWKLWWEGFKLFLGRVSTGRRAVADNCRQMTRCRCRLLPKFWHFRCCCCCRPPSSSSLSLLRLLFTFVFSSCSD